MCEGLIAHQSQPGRLEEEKQKFLPLPSIERKSSGQPVLSLFGKNRKFPMLL
jgi:hypothetical protein